ncbi:METHYLTRANSFERASE PMT1-RELATED [Salix purpurea]|uniref:Methyltransferase n=1 Tax=Salix purpurea TaxID=77065 RepID=A0A9Q0SPR6_SALPP|nr:METHYLTRANSFERASE PMT1-RELATED [Salix purpurea]
MKEGSGLSLMGVPMEACITPYSDQQHKAKGSGLAPWPARLTTPPPRLADFGYSAEMFEKDTEVWQHRVENYWNLLSPKIQPDTLRNYRCESFSIYPRTYDLLHAWTVFSDIEKKDCGAEDLLIEMDRILRPTGFIIIRDKPSVVEFVKKHLSALHWEAVATGDAEQDTEQGEDEVVFIIQKKMWLTSTSFSDTE